MHTINTHRLFLIFLTRHLQIRPNMDKLDVVIKLFYVKSKFLIKIKSDDMKALFWFVILHFRQTGINIFI